MEVSVSAEERCARVGLDETEIDSPDVWKSLQPMMNRYRQMDYLFIIYELKMADRE